MYELQQKLHTHLLRLAMIMVPVALEDTTKMQGFYRLYTAGFTRLTSVWVV